jgi:hypothetical protein
LSEPGSQKSEKEQLRREIKEAEERQNRAEREMQANISRRGATRQGWAKIKAEAEKGNLHRGEKEARKQQDPVGKEGLPSRYEKVDVTGQAWGGSGREESTNKRKRQALFLFSPSPRLAENQKEGSIQEIQEYMCKIHPCRLFRLFGPSPC